MDKNLELQSSQDIGNTVVCDFCNADYTDSEEVGGVMVGSYAVCPTCAKDITNPAEISAYCPASTQFRHWILEMRGGDNTIKLYA